MFSNAAFRSWFSQDACGSFLLLHARFRWEHFHRGRPWCSDLCLLSGFVWTLPAIFCVALRACTKSVCNHRCAARCPMAFPGSRAPSSGVDKLSFFYWQHLGLLIFLRFDFVWLDTLPIFFFTKAPHNVLLPHLPFSRDSPVPHTDSFFCSTQ